jgi:phosphomevalonate kinase
MSVALVRAFFKYSGMDLVDSININRMFRLALAAHRKAQGNLGSGIDIAASAFGGVLQYTVGINEQCEQLMPKTIALWNELPFLIIFTGSSESTRRMVSGVGELKNKTPEIYSTIMRKLEKTSKEGCLSYEQQDKEAFLKSIKDYYDFMDELGLKSGMPIISDVHQKIAKIVQQNKGVYKPSGAGSGDIGVAFSETSNTLINIRREIENSGFTCIDTKIVNRNF